jgi:hypothetical protein
VTPPEPRLLNRQTQLQRLGARSRSSGHGQVVLPGRSAVWVGLGARAPMLPPAPHERALTEFFENRQMVEARRLFRIIRKSPVKP